MNILEQIIEHKYKEVAERKSLYPVKLLEQSIYFSTPCVSMKKYLLREDKSGIIAEIKRKSPSKGQINPYVSIERTSIGYMQAGASALSILTDKHFFGGSDDDLTIARQFNFCPLLRKDFVVDEYQITEAKSIGALAPARVVELNTFAHSLGLEVLFEVHNEDELYKEAIEQVDMVGVNNRDLKTFQVSIEVSKRLSSLIPQHVVKVSESGISDPATIIELKQLGYRGFLMGENFMKHSQPEKAANDFIKELRRLEHKIGA
jgi:indole-3-glycerol phosphate synthase